MKHLPIIIAFFLFLTGCKSVFLPAYISSADFFPRETDIPGWHIVKDKELEKITAGDIIPGAEHIIIREYENSTGKIVKAELVEFDDNYSAYSYFSKLRGYGSCFDEGCADSCIFKNNKISLFIFKKRVLLFSAVQETDDARGLLFSFVPGTGSNIVSMEFDGSFLKNNPLNFGKNYILYNKSSFRDFEGLDGIYHTRYSNYRFYVSERRSRKEASYLYNKIINSGNYAVVDSDAEFISLKNDNSGKKKYIELYGKWLLGASDFSEFNDIAEIISSIKKRIIKE